MTSSTFVYVTYIRTTPERLWEALTTDGEFMKQYWFGSVCESDWKAGSAWKMTGTSGKVTDSGEIVQIDPPKRMVIHWMHKMRPELESEGPTRCVIELEQAAGSVKLSITHSSEREGSKVIEAVSGGWPKILSNLKSLLEGGQVAVGEAYPAKPA